MKKIIIISSLIVFSLAACDSQKQSTGAVAENTTVGEVASAVAEAPKTQDFSVLIQQAETLYAQSKKANHAWTINLDRLKDARLAAEEGDMVAAVANAEEAIKLSKLALKQAESEKDLWQARVPQ